MGIAEDMLALAKVTGRLAGSEGERAMLHEVRQRIPDGWLVRVEGFVGDTRPDWTGLGHAALLVLIGLVGALWPGVALPFAALVTVSWLGEGTGRFALLRRFLLKSASYNLVARDARPEPTGSVVLTANLDVPTWRSTRLYGLHLRERAAQLAFWCAVALTFGMAVRAFGGAIGPFTVEIHLLTIGVMLACAVGGWVRRPHPDGADPAGAPAVLLELLRRFSVDPVAGTEVWVAFTGCGTAFQDGMSQFLALHGKSLREPVLVLALDAPERAPLHAVVSEGPLIAQAHRATGPALVERLRWAGVHLPEIRVLGASNARAAQVLGVRSLALAGGDGPPSGEAAAYAADVLEVMVRWYAEDVGQVADDRERLAVLGKALEGLRSAERLRRRWRSAPASATPPPTGGADGVS